MGRDEVVVIMDTREPVAIQRVLEGEGIVVERQQLSVGDFVCSGAVVLERKRGMDLVGSIQDNRLFDQMSRLKDAYETPVLVLEDFPSIFDLTGMSRSSIYGALAYVGYKMHVPVIPTRDERDTALLVKRIAIREQVEDRVPVIARVAPRNMSVEDRRGFILEGLANTGPRRAEQLLEAFETPAGVFRAIKASRVVYTRTGNPKGITGPLKEIRGIGVKWLQANQDLIWGPARPLDALLDGEAAPD